MKGSSVYHDIARTDDLLLQGQQAKFHTKLFQGAISKQLLLKTTQYLFVCSTFLSAKYRLMGVMADLDVVVVNKQHKLKPLVQTAEAVN